MRRFLLLIAVAFSVVCYLSTSASCCEMSVLNEAGKKFEKEGGKLAKLMHRRGGKPYILRVPWEYQGLISLSPEARDKLASQALFNAAESKVKTWNEDPTRLDQILFGGVIFKQNEGGWSPGPAPIPGHPHVYRCGGLAVGYVLIVP